MRKKQDLDVFNDLDSELDDNINEYNDDLDILNDDNLDNTSDDDLDDSLDCISDDDDDDGDDEEVFDDIDIMVKFNTNNHKIEGKHSLSRDTIFKGKIEENPEYLEYNTFQSDELNLNDGLPIEVGSSYEFESKYYEDYIDRLNLSRYVYDLLKEKTDLDFSSNRRKPNKQAFNHYYKILLNDIGKDFTKSEIFVELSYYFTDNIFNMFKLLDKEYATQIFVELKKNGYLNNLNNINFI